jgi:hypothetical protein
MKTIRSQWLAVLIMCATACTTTLGDEGSSSTSSGGEGEIEGGGDVTPPPPEGGGETVEPPVATSTCVDDEEVIAADGSLHLEPGGCALVDDTSQCCLDTTGTKWICTGGDEFPGVLDVYDYASYPCAGL